MILDRDSVILFWNVVETYNYVYFITLKKYNHIYPTLLIKIVGSTSDHKGVRILIKNKLQSNPRDNFIMTN